jgi:hypothetical protein
MDLDKLAKERFLGLKIFPYIDEDFAAEEILKDTPYENDENLRRKITLRIEAAKMIGGSSGVLTSFLTLYYLISLYHSGHQPSDLEGLTFLTLFGLPAFGHVFGGRLAEIYYSRKFSKYKMKNSESP